MNVNWRALLRRLLPYAVVAASGFLVAFLVVRLFIFSGSNVPEPVKVPAVLGLTFDEASGRLAAAGFKAKKGETRASSIAPPTTVLAQTPAAGTRQLRGSEITLDLSEGEKLVAVPSIIGMTEPLALAALESAGLEAGQITTREDEAARGKVLETAPAAGKRVAPSTRVDIVMSEGPASVNTPDVIGQNYAAARAMLEQVGLVVGEVQFDSATTAPLNSVMAQTPAAAANVARGTRVTLRVSGTRP